MPAGSSCGRAALRHVTAVARGEPLDPALRVTVNFHPDRLAGGAPLLVALARDGRYRSQFETGTSNGGLTAHPGGDRWRWESRLFGRAYDHAPAAARPKYGALNHRRRATGGSPRFGSAHLRLAPHVLARTTFCYPDSAADPVAFGTAAALDLLPRLAADHPGPLDDYVEAHIHGPIRLACDVEALVLDPSYVGTDVEQWARRLPCPVSWHDGFRLPVGVLARHADFRGADIVRLGARVAVDGQLDPAGIGRAARSGQWDGQRLKYLWHCLAHFGAPAPPP